MYDVGSSKHFRAIYLCSFLQISAPIIYLLFFSPKTLYFLVTGSFSLLALNELCYILRHCELVCEFSGLESLSPLYHH